MIETEQEGNETPEYPTMPEQEEPSPEIEGFPLGKEIISPPDYFILQIPKLRSNRKRKYMRMRQNNQNQKESSRVL